MYERFLILLKENGMKQIDFCRASGIPQSTISTWKNGKHELKSSTLTKIADFFGVSVNWLLGKSEEREEREGVVKIPVFRCVSAGNAKLNANEDVIGYEEIPAQAAKSGTYFGLKIKGDSMTPTILDGDVVIVRKQDTADSGDIVVALVNGDDGVCKQLIKRQSGIVLRSLNEVYGEYVFEKEETNNVRIIGKVEQLRRNF